MSLPYGRHPSQFGKLMVDPSVAGESIPVVVVVHGGFWHVDYSLIVENAVARDLVACGALVWNVEYRRVGEDGGGWPATGADVVAAMSALDDVVRPALPADVAVRLDVDHVAVVGHSAGAQLAVWAVSRLGAVTARSRITTVVAQAGVLDMVAAGMAGRDSVRDVMGVDYADAPQRFRDASPAHQDPFAAHVVAIHGDADMRVPAEMSVRYVDRVVSVGQSAELVLVPDAGHDDFLDPRTRCHRATLRALGVSRNRS